MKRHHISASLYCFLRLQALCLGVVVASWLIFWAVGQPVSNVRDLFFYVLIQVNLTALMLWPMKALYQNRQLPYHWPVHVVSIFAITSVVVVASALAIHRVHSWQMPFGVFLHQ